MAYLGDSKLDPRAQYWAEEIRLAKKREKSFQHEAEEVTKIYEAEKAGENSFNILYANTETLLPACYNQLPRAVVERRYRDKDRLAKASSEVLQRVVQYLMDTNTTEEESFHDLMQQAVLGALVPGRGITRFRYEPKFKIVPTALGDEKEDDEEEGAPDSNASPIHPEPAKTEQVERELIYGETVCHTQLIFGYARRWAKVPWIAFVHFMTKEDLTANFGEEVAEDIPLVKGAGAGQAWRTHRDDEEDENEGSAPVAEVYEIWHKGSKKVIFFCEKAQTNKLLKELDDPLQLTGFYPIPEPLQFILKQTGLKPTPMYKMYEQQAKELNRISMRINRVLNAMKVRGFYDGTIQGLDKLLTQEDNTLLPVENVAALIDGKNLQNSIWFMPLQELIVVLQQLMLGRDNCRKTIYEITSISDIMRGDTSASETFGAQNLKSQWGTQRLQRIQQRVQRYVRECLQIMAEIAIAQLAEETIIGMTNLDFATDEDVQQAQQLQRQIQQLMLQQPPPQPGQPPAPPSPQIQQAMMQVQEILAKPKWSEVFALLQNDVVRCYRIDIETNSTINPKNQEQQKQMTEALGALSTLFQSFGPVVQEGALPLAALKQITMSVVRRFEFGKEVEDALEKMPDQIPPKGDPKQQAAIEKAQKEVVAEKQEIVKGQQALEQQANKLGQQKEQIKTEIESARQQMQLEAERQQMQLEGLIDKALMQIEQMLTKHSMDVEGKLQTVQIQRDADQKVDQRVQGVKQQQEDRVQKKQSQQSETKMLQAVQGILQGAQITNQNIEAIMQQIAALKAPAGPRRMKIGWDDGETATITQQ